MGNLHEIRPDGTNPIIPAQEETRQEPAISPPKEAPFQAEAGIEIEGTHTTHQIRQQFQDATTSLSPPLPTPDIVAKNTRTDIRNEYREILKTVIKNDGQAVLDKMNKLQAETSGPITILQGISQKARKAFEMVRDEALQEPVDVALLRQLLSSRWGQNVLKHHPDLYVSVADNVPALQYALFEEVVGELREKLAQQFSNQIAELHQRVPNLETEIKLAKAEFDNAIKEDNMDDDGGIMRAEGIIEKQERIADLEVKLEQLKAGMEADIRKLFTSGPESFFSKQTKKSDEKIQKLKEELDLRLAGLEQQVVNGELSKELAKQKANVLLQFHYTEAYLIHRAELALCSDVTTDMALKEQVPMGNKLKALTDKKGLNFLFNRTFPSTITQKLAAELYFKNQPKGKATQGQQYAWWLEQGLKDLDGRKRGFPGIFS